MINANTLCGVLSIVWIVSWFAAIWIASYREQLFITGLFAIFLAVASYDEDLAEKYG